MLHKKHIAGILLNRIGQSFGNNLGWMDIWGLQSERLRSHQLQASMILDGEDKQDSISTVVWYLPYNDENQGKPMGVLMEDTRGIIHWVD